MPSDAARILDRLLEQWWKPETPYLTDGTKLYRLAREESGEPIPSTKAPGKLRIPAGHTER